VSCDWSIQTLGVAWISQRDIGQLEAEGLGLQALLGDAVSQSSSTGAAAAIEKNQPPGIAHEAFLEVDGASLSLLVVGILMMIGHAIALAVCLSNPADDDMAWIAIPGCLTGLAMCFGGWSMRRLQSRGWSQLGAQAALIPVSPGWLISLPIGVWTLVVLNRPSVKAAFRTGVDSLRTRQSTDSP
jgi:hypothetical protein